MKTINILHLYAEAMDLYGDKKNLEVLCQRIQESGAQAEVKTCELGEKMELDGVDMVYLGHGKARNLAAMAPHFCSYGDEIKAHIEDGQLWFVTGNARELFGREFTTVSGEKLLGIGLFDYCGIENNKVFVADMVGQAAFDENLRCYGFANRTACLIHPNGNPYPLFKEAKGFSDGEQEEGCEGTLYHNFFATWAMGPVLVRNPGLMREILRRLGLDPSICDFSLEERALQLVLEEFKDQEKEA